MIKKAVIPAAGFGTRFLPATKSSPKEMLPIVDTPVIQYVVEEAVAAGVNDIIMVIGSNKRAIEEHFDRSFMLEGRLEAKGDSELLERMRHISEMADIHFVWQKEQKGLGDAVYCARHHINGEPFVVMLGDTVIDSEVPATAQLIKVFERYKSPVTLLEEVPRELVSRYGVMDGKEIDEDLFQVHDFVEKPSVEQAPSNLVIASRYILTADIFDYLAVTKRGKGNEIQLTDAMRMMVKDRAMYGWRLDGRRCDIGSKEGFVKTNLEFALKREDMNEDLRHWIKKLAQTL
ncbi:MAG: UTP--glucose-1-phosphate uridylyltransferase GalU [Phycisphaerae bacterium]